MKARCDICLESNVNYTHFTKDFVLPEDDEYPEYRDDGAWALCPSCHSLVLAGDKTEILLRVLTIAPRHEVIDMGWAARVFLGFMQHRTGEWIEDTSTVIGEWRGKQQFPDR